MKLREPQILAVISWICIVGFGVYYFFGTAVRAPHGFDVSIETPGGEVPFRLVLWPNSRGTRWGASIDFATVQGAVEPDEFAIAKVIEYKPDAGELTIELLPSESVMTLTHNASGTWQGEWSIRRTDGEHSLPLRAIRGGHGGMEAIDTAEFRHDFPAVRRLRDITDGSTIEINLFEHSNRPDVYALCEPLIPRGHLMQGRIDGRVMRLAYFDGDNAYLLRAEYLGQGEYEIDLWNGTWEHRTLVPVMP